MRQQALELVRSRSTVTPPGKTPTLPAGETIAALTRLCDEAERAVIAKIALAAVPQRVEPAEQPQRVRYAYD